MKNVAALLITNSAVRNVTVDTFLDSQQELNKPMVIMYDQDTKEVIQTFSIAADTIEELTEMYKYKYFETMDLQEDTYIKMAGAYFIGVNPVDIKKERQLHTVAH